MSQGSICLVDPVHCVKDLVIKTNFASTCITGDMTEFLLEFEPYWLL